jgi:hypothetical protein
LGVPATVPAGFRVGVFGFEGFGLPAEWEKAPLDLEARVRGMIEAEGHVLKNPALLVRDAGVAYGCAKLDEGCMGSIASAIGADAVVVGKVEAVEGTDAVRVRVRVYRADKSIVEIERVLPATVDGLAEGFEAVAREVARESGTKAPASMPDAASVPVIGPPPPPVAIAGTRKTAWLGTGAGFVAAGVLAAGFAAWMASRWFEARRAYREGVADWVTPDGMLAIPLDGPPGRTLCRTGPGPIEDAAAAELGRRGVFDACRRGRVSSIAGWSLAGTGAALTALGAAFLIAGSGKFSRPALGSVSPFVGPDSFGLTFRAEFR